MKFLSEIFEKNEHMKIGMYWLATIGVWPLKLEKYPKFRIIYKIYSNVMYYYFISFVTRQFIELYLLIRIGNVTRIMQNASLTLLTAISAIRTYVVRGKIMRKIINNIIAMENRIMASEDEEVLKLYKHNVWLAQLASKFFIGVGVMAAAPFYFGPYAERLAYPDEYPPDNITGKIHYKLPLSSYVPYNYTDHYKITFWWQVADGWTAECYVVYTDSFLFGLMIYPVGQLQIIQHMFKNFRKYAQKIQEQTKTTYEAAAYATLRALIIYHKEIIAHVEIMDSAFRFLMLLDFASCSLQMAILVFQVIMTDFNLVMLHALIFLAAMVIQLFLFHWNANEITVESLNVAPAVYDSEWYEEPQEVQKAMQLVVLRSQKPMTISIGPFYPMSTSTAVSILKATYSYAMLLRQSYLRREGLA